MLAPLAGECSLAAWLSPKGRVRYLMWALFTGDSVDLVLRRTDLPTLREELSRFVFRSKVRLEDASDGHILTGLVDTPGTPRLTPGESDDEWLRLREPGTRATRAYRLPGSGGRALLSVRSNGAAYPEDLVTRIGLEVQLAGPSTWHLANLQAGIPELVAETRGRYLPQMLNLDRLGAISFDKGCYPGQEVVARTQHLGRLKRRMFYAGTSEASLEETRRQPEPRIGDPVFRMEGNDMGKVGEIIDVASLDREGDALLAVIEIEAAGSLVRLHPGGPGLSFQLPALSPPDPVVDADAGADPRL